MRDLKRDSRQGKPEPGSMGSAPLPAGLRTLVIQRAAGAVVMGFAAMFLAVMSRDGRALFGLILSAYLAYLAVSVVLDHRTNRIAEVPVICSSCTVSAAWKIVPSIFSPSGARSTVVFRPMQEKDACFYTYTLPGDRTMEIQPDMRYVIYFSVNDPNQLLAYMML